MLGARDLLPLRSRKLGQTRIAGDLGMYASQLDELCPRQCERIDLRTADDHHFRDLACRSERAVEIVHYADGGIVEVKIAATGDDDVVSTRQWLADGLPGFAT